ncbi:MAG: AAA-like domain-containing protein [Anaerolineales bacterium]
MNPFTFGNPINEPERFVGRKTEIRQIVNRLLSSAHESTSIIGERRIGKTSLLNYLAHPEISTSLGLTSDKFCFVYVDFQGLTDITPTRFWQRVLKKMSHSICDESLKPAIEALSNQSQFDLFDLEDLFQSSVDKGLTIVLLMDEFEYVTENPNFKSDFFGGLRALAIHSGVALVPATRRELVALCHSEEIKGSPFFNIFANVVIRPFNPEEVDELLVKYTKNNEHPIQEDEKKLILNLAGGYPFFVQMAGHYLIEAKIQGLESDTLQEFVVDNFDQQAASHYNYLWTHCSESEKIMLLTILTLGMQSQSKKTVPTLETLTRFRPRAPHDISVLMKRGLLDEQNGIYSLFSFTFGRWIRQEIMVAPGEEESERSADGWLKSGGQEELKQAKGILLRFKKKYWPILGDLAKELSIEFAAVSTVELIRILLF